MPTHVRFVLNKVTGEIEEFLIDDQDRTLSEAEHDRIALEVGKTVARDPAVTEVVAGAPRLRPLHRTEPTEGETDRSAEGPAIVRRS